MGKLIETITNPFSPIKGCIESLNIYDDYVEINRVEMSSVSFSFQDFAKVDMQPASLSCAYAMIVFLEKDYFKVKFIQGLASSPEPNRLYVLDGIFSYAKANEFVSGIVTKLNATIRAHKQGGTATMPTLSETDKIAVLKQYKELLDAGILTQDEFDTKKKKLLEEQSTATVSLIKSEDTKREQSPDIVCCPKCGSTEFHSGKRGWSIWTGLLGSSKVIMTCLKCGHKWTTKDYEK